jgi:serine phosphatase RsbU (regulator of sigma subunit)/DNA-binding NarL/FixJ family response regulator
MGNKSIRVMVADDQVIIRSGLSALLMTYDDMQLVGEAADGEQAIELCKHLQPDVLLMDIKMPRVDGLAATGVIHQRWPDIQILVLTSFTDKESIQGALNAGASGYLLKDASADELVQAIREVYQGHRTVAPLASEILVKTERLEALVEAVQKSTIEESQLPQLLSEHIPSIFPNSQIEVRIFPNYKILTYAPGIPAPLPEAAWDWVRAQIKPRAFSPGEPYPWAAEHHPEGRLILGPILDRYSKRPVGGLGILNPGKLEDPYDLMPIFQSLADCIATAHEKAQIQARRLSQQRVADELVSAGKIQASILPHRLPDIPGWNLVAKLESARETSGDFYDFIPLENGKLGIVIADVTDKGMGAALFMALSSTLIRTYAIQYPTLPAFAMGTVNRRILSDTRGSMYVTAFFGVLDPQTGRMYYVNAGHPPPFLLSDQKGKPVDRLKRTGMALGVTQDAAWQQKLIKFSPGDILVLYTDGITEAQNDKGTYFGEERILQAVRSKRESPAPEIQESLLAEVKKFLGGAKVQDDIAIMVVAREKRNS